MEELKSQIQDTYNKQYNNENEIWRDLGGQQKSSNIVKLCSRLNPTSVIDVGSGDGAVLKWLDNKQFCDNITSVEISESGIKKILQKKLKSVKEVKLFDGYKIPFGDKQFQLSLCSHVLEHVEHPRTLLREIGRVSEYQYFEVPIDFSFFVDSKLKHYLSYGHINIYTPALFKFLIKSEGFEVIDESYIFNSSANIKHQFKNKTGKYLIQKLKNFLVSITPYKKIKPNTYGVLCKHSGKFLEIF